jgi:hypothetical protein
LTNASGNDLRFMAHSRDRLAQFIPQLVEIMTTHIFEFHLLEIVPNTLDRVKIWGVARQTQEVNISGGALCQVGFDLTIISSLPPIWRRRCLRNRTTSALVNARFCPQIYNWPAGVIAPIIER